jgi:hypothetical protein
MNNAPETLRHQHERFLLLAAEAEANARRLSDPKAKAEWTAIAQGWMALANAIWRDVN